jgi:alpha-tubulin suppressor-like RCC1 family protein
MPCPLVELPADVLAAILGWLDPENLARAAVACLQFDSLAERAAARHAHRLGSQLSSRERVPSLALRLLLAFAEQQQTVGVGRGHVLCIPPSGQVLSWGSDIHEISRENFDADGTRFEDEDIFMGHLAREVEYGMGNDCIPEAVIGLPVTKVQAVVAGFNLSIIITDAGEAYAWGKDVVSENGEHASMRPAIVPSLLGVRVVCVACSSGGYPFYLALDALGSLFQGGFDKTATRQLCISSSESARERTAHISCGDNHMLAVSTTGEMHAWVSSTIMNRVEDFKHMPAAWLDDEPGDHIITVEFASLSLGTGLYSNQKLFEPSRVSTLGQVVRHASAGGRHSLAVSDDGVLYSFGANSSGQLGFGDLALRQWPTALEGSAFGGAAMREAHAGRKHSVALTSRGHVYTFGAPAAGGRLGHEDDERDDDDILSIPRLVSALAAARVTEVSVCGDQTMLLVDNGALCTLGQFHCYLDLSRNADHQTIHGVFCACCNERISMTDDGEAFSSDEEGVDYTDCTPENRAKRCLRSCKDCLVKNPAKQNVESFLAACYERGLLAADNA